MIALNLRCLKHPRYMAVHPPRVANCVDCNCAGIWTIAQWARHAEWPDQARETAMPIHRSLLHSLRSFASDTEVK